MEDIQKPVAEPEDEQDEIAVIIRTQGITAECVRIESRPDVSDQEQMLWIRQDPEYPPEHYACTLSRDQGTLLVYQSVGADYPEEDEEGTQQDLYAYQRELLLTPEFLLENTVLKALSIDRSSSKEDWIEHSGYETLTPDQTYASYQQLRFALFGFLGQDIYDSILNIVVEGESDEDESEE